MSSISELMNEVSLLRVELEEKSVQIEAMTQFEHEFSLKVQDVIRQKEVRITELEDKVGMIPGGPAPPAESSGILLDLLREREHEVEILEARVNEIMSERNDHQFRESVSDSLLDYEKRVEHLRMDLHAKDCEITQLRSILTQLPSPSPTPDLTRELEDLRQTVSDKDSIIAQLSHELAQRRVLALPDSSASSIPDLPPLPPRLSFDGKLGGRKSLSVVGQIVAISPRNSEAHLRRLEDLQQARTKLSDALDEVERFKRESLTRRDGQLTDLVETFGAEGLVQVCIDQLGEYKRLASMYQLEVESLRKVVRETTEDGLLCVLGGIESTLAIGMVSTIMSGNLKQLQDDNVFLRKQLNKRDVLGDTSITPPLPSTVQWVHQECQALPIVPVDMCTPPLPESATRRDATTEPESLHVPDGCTPPLPEVALDQSVMMDAISDRLADEIATRRKVEETNESLRLRIGVEKKEFKQLLESAIKQRDEAVCALRDVPQPVPNHDDFRKEEADVEIFALKNEVRMNRELVAKLRAENTELLACAGDTAEVARLRQELRDKENDLKKIRLNVMELRKDVKQVEQAKEDQEMETRRLVRTIESMRARKKTSEDTTTVKQDIDDLKSELRSMKNAGVVGRGANVRRVSRSPPSTGLVTPASVATPVAKRKLSMFSPTATMIVQPTEGGMRGISVHQSEVLCTLQTHLIAVEDELANARRALDVDAKLALDMERLQRLQLENSNVKLAAQVEDLRYQLKRRVAGKPADELAITDDDVCVQTQFELRQRTPELDRLRIELHEGKIEGLTLRSTILDLEFGRTAIERKCERLSELVEMQKEQIHALRTVDRMTPVKPGPDTDQLLSVLQAENDKLVSEKRALTLKVKQLESHAVRSDGADRHRLQEEIDELRRQRDQDKAAIGEAERVLAMVSQTEAKYVKVAKENQKLRKDIAALNDDTFWNDLESLQTQHKSGVRLLRECRNLVTRRDLVEAITALVGDV